MEQFEVPHKLDASSFEMLQKKMLAVNVRLGGKVVYDIRVPSYQGAKWYAFYYERLNAAEHLKKQLEGAK
jgi:hypothetical protein